MVLEGGASGQRTGDGRCLRSPRGTPLGRGLRQNPCGAGLTLASQRPSHPPLLGATCGLARTGEQELRVLQFSCAHLTPPGSRPWGSGAFFTEDDGGGFRIAPPGGSINKSQPFAPPMFSKGLAGVGPAFEAQKPWGSLGRV